jgi:hypothetical protein
MRKFSKILESAESDIVLDIKDILMEFKDSGFDIKIDEAHGTYFVQLSAIGTPDAPAAKIDMMELIEMISVANERIKDLGMSQDTYTINMSGKSNSSNAVIKLQYKKEEFTANKDVHGWKEFKSYCEKVLGIDGIEGADTFDSYFRINVVDKDSGWPGLPDDKAGWSIDIDDIGPNTFAAAFPGYEDFLKKLLSRQIDYNLVWHLCREEGDNHRIISDPVKLAEANKNHNPMKFDKEGIEAVETLLEMAEKFPEKIEIKKHNI